MVMMTHPRQKASANDCVLSADAHARASKSERERVERKNMSAFESECKSAKGKKKNVSASKGIDRVIRERVMMHQERTAFILHYTTLH